MKRSTLAAASAAILLSTLAASSAPPITLHVNTGLWEITSEVVMHNAPQIPASMLAQLPPERRARVMAAMKASMAAAAKPHTRQSCVTQKQLDRPFQGLSERSGETCTETVLSATSTVENIKVVCTGKNTMNGTFHFEAPTPATMSGRIDMLFGEGGKTMSSSSELRGRWLGSDCGSVKPRGG